MPLLWLEESVCRGDRQVGRDRWFAIPGSYAKDHIFRQSLLNTPQFSPLVRVGTELDRWRLRDVKFIPVPACDKFPVRVIDSERFASPIVASHQRKSYRIL